MKKLLVLVCLLLASPAWATITAIGAIGTANSTSAGTSLVITTSATLESGNVAIVAVASDNSGITSGDFSEITSVADSASNPYTKLCEHTYPGLVPGINAGATASLWITRATSQLTSGGTITITLGASKPSRAAVAFEFTVGQALEIAGTCQTAEGGGATDPPSMAVSGLSSESTLYFRMHAEEDRSGGDFTTLTASYTSAGNALADSGAGSTSMLVKTEYIIATGTGSTSNPADDSDGDMADLFVALREMAVVGNYPQIIIVE